MGDADDERERPADEPDDSADPASPPGDDEPSEPTDDEASEPTDEAADEPTDEGADEPGDEGADGPGDEGADEPGDEAADEPTDEGADEPGDDEASEPTDEAADEPGDAADDQPTDETTGEPPAEDDEGADASADDEEASTDDGERDPSSEQGPATPAVGQEDLPSAEAFIEEHPEAEEHPDVKALEEADPVEVPGAQDDTDGDEPEDGTSSDEADGDGDATAEADTVGGASGDGDEAGAEGDGVESPTPSDPTDNPFGPPEDETPPETQAAPATHGEGAGTPPGIADPTPTGGKHGKGGKGGTTDSGGITAGFPETGHAPDDEERPLAEHVEEMARRFLTVVLVMGAVGLVVLPFADDLINFLWYSFLGPDTGVCPGPNCPQEWRPHIYHPLSLVLARLKMAALVGFVIGLPVAVYQIYRFMRPGLYPHERRYYLAAVPTSLVLASAGVSFAYYVVLPTLFSYFSAYSTRAAELAFGLSETFGLIVMLLGFFALIFQIPLFVMLAIMMGVTTRRWLEQRRIYFWMGFGAIAFVFSPDPTGMAPLLVAVTMIVLFEGTLLMLRWTNRGSALFSERSLAKRRPYAWVITALVGYTVSTAPAPPGYYDQLPAAFRDGVANILGSPAVTPFVVGAGLIVLFEVIGYLVRRLVSGGSRRTALRVRLAFMRLRAPAWLVAIVLGYLASPNPTFLVVFEEITLAPPIAVAVAAGLIVAYELLRIALGKLRPGV